MSERSLTAVAFTALLVGSVLTAGGSFGAAAAGNTGTAAGGTDWPTLGHDERNTGSSPNVSGPLHNLTTMWQFNPGASYSSSPVVTNGTVYVANDNGTFYALNATTGAVEWSRNGSFDGQGTAAAVTDGVVYVGNGTALEALDAEDGSQVWAYPTGATTETSPAVVNGTVYAGNADGTVFALNATTGAKEWTYATGSGTTPSPVVANGTVYTNGGDDQVYALAADNGSKRWNYSTVLDPTAPAVANGIVYVGSSNETLYALNTSTGSQEWTFDVGGWIHGSPAVANGTVYAAGSNSHVYAINTTTGTERWNQSITYAWASPAIADQTLYITTDRGTLYGFDKDTGVKRLQYVLTSGTNMYSSPAVVNGTVYAGVYQYNGAGLFAVTESPIADFESTAADATVDETITFDASTSEGSRFGDISTYEWDFEGDGSIDATGEQVSMSFDHGGGYLVTLTVTDHRGVSNTTDVYVPVSDPSRGPLTDEWPTRGYDAARTGNATATGLSSASRQRMRKPMEITGSIVIANDTVYSPSREGISALNGSTGVERWNSSKVGRAPTVENGTIYSGNVTKSRFGPSGTGFYALDADSGAVDWKGRTQGFIDYSPAVANGTVYVTSDYGTGSKVYAFDSDTGAELWTYSTADGAKAPSVRNNTVVSTTTDGYVFALDSNGAELWNKSLNSNIYVNPTIANGTVFVGTQNGNVTALDLETGAESWSYSTADRIDTSVAVANETVYAGSEDGNLYALNATTGQKQWDYTAGHSVSTAPAVVNGRVYFGAINQLDVQNTDYRVYGLNATTGAEEWNATLSQDRPGTVIAVGDRIYVSTDNEGETDYIYAFEGTADTGPTAVATASSTSASPAETINFDASNSTDNRGIERVRWQFDDGTSATGFQVDHSYSSAGTYHATVTVTDAAGYRASETITISVSSPNSGSSDDDDDDNDTGGGGGFSGGGASGGDGTTDDTKTATPSETPEQDDPESATPTETEPTQSSDSTPTQTDDTTSTTAGSTSQETTDEAGPGFGALAVVVAVALFTLVRRRRTG